jgi:hypothetical protein
VICNAAYPCDRGRFSVEQTYAYDLAGRPADRMSHVSFARLDAGGGLIEQTDSGRFRQTWGYDDTGWLAATGYPAACTGSTANTCGSSRQVGYGYVRGFLTSVDDPALGAGLTYHLDGTLDQVVHASGGADTYGTDPSGLTRVGTITLAGGSLTLGPYSYDASGNVLAIGGVDDSFGYDAASRLTSASLLSGTYSYDYSYDQYDNRLWGTVDTSDNHLIGGGNAYDDFGNWIAAPGGIEMRYDGLDKITAMFDNAAAAASCSGTSANCTLSIYDPEDLRILELRFGQGPFTWTLRDLDGKILSELRGTGVPTLPPRPPGHSARRHQPGPCHGDRPLQPLRHRDPGAERRDRGRLHRPGEGRRRRLRHQLHARAPVPARRRPVLPGRPGAGHDRLEPLRVRGRQSARFRGSIR